MASIETGIYEIGRLDQLAYRDTPITRIDPRAKVVTTLAFLVAVVSFGKYDILPMLPFALFPIAMASLGDLPVGFLGKRLLQAAPFAIVVGMFNPLLDREILLHIGELGISGGWVSYASIVLRFLLTTGAALVLIGTTDFSTVCMALDRLGAPSVFATQLLFLYRYIFVLAEEALTMARARSLRSFDGRGMGLGPWAQMLGSLLLRTYSRAQRVYQAMQCRGFDGRVRVARQLGLRGSDVVFTLGWSGLFALFRIVNVPLALGEIATRWIG